MFGIKINFYKVCHYAFCAFSVVFTVYYGDKNECFE